MPKVFETARAAAVEQVEIRLIILKHMMEAGIPWRTGPGGKVERDERGEAILDFVPRNFTDFAAWTAAKHCAAVQLLEIPRNRDDAHDKRTVKLSDLRKISRTTLNQTYHEKLRKRIDTAIDLIKAQAARQLEKENKTSQIEELTVEVTYLRKVVIAQEQEARDSRQEALKATTALRKEKQLRLRNEAKLKSDYAELQQQNIELLKKFAEAVPLKRVPRSS